MSNEKVGRLFTGTLFTILIIHKCEQRFYFEVAFKVASRESKVASRESLCTECLFCLDPGLYLMECLRLFFEYLD